jgi:hypothetical protein
MGMYLGVYKIKSDDPDKQHPNAEMLTDNQFEFGKFVGDFAIVINSDFDSDYISCEAPYCCGIVYTRPKDFDKAREWLKSTKDIPKGNKPRILKLLNSMEKDKELWINYG